MLRHRESAGRGLFFHLFFPLFYTIVIGPLGSFLASSVPRDRTRSSHRIVIPELLPDLYGLVFGLLSPAALNTMLLKISLPTIISLLSSADAFVPRSGLRAPAASSSSSSSSSLYMAGEALIVQNKGGGHGELGYQLAKTLQNQEQITSVTILQDDACDDTKEPFKSYAADLPGVKVIKASLSDESMSADDVNSLLGGDTFEYVWDNASKGPVGSGKAICDAAKGWNPKLFAYVSSAGMYQPTDDTVFPMAETTPIKESAGQAQFEAYAAEIGLPLVTFRPQYIYGPKANKYSYIDWYFDRICRGEPLPIPGDGTQIVSLTNSEDVAFMLASPLNNETAAVEQRYFNCGTDIQLSYDDVAKLCAQVAGVEDYTIVHYDAAKLGKGTFPFRPANFYVAPDKIKEYLTYGSAAEHTVRGDLSEFYFENYKARGSLDKDVDFSKDKEILDAL